ncbi:MAG: hypothetical protein IPJ89_01005 [Candidatus Iainarchaeum archaeon]|uniref:Uncharacterized protein n=1 Tax=Candidatus Iainarchaeum sp. TaxID=3101447 RepID=A0A7T9DKA7_9ARCH|nr:MAG: hypothetical protein IPJ89_01005 [Candidatus Diapherotrites archaeon]
MQKALFFIILLIVVAGCLDAKLTAGETAACLRASSAELTHMQPCTTAPACQTLFRKTQASGIGTKTNSSILVERAESQTINGWLRLTDATQKLQKVRAACTNGTIGELWNQSQLAGTALGEALLYSERSQIYSWQALQQTMQAAERAELNSVRDSAAFQSYAKAVEFIQEVKNQTPHSALAQKVQTNTRYFGTLAQRISGKESNAYAIDTARGFDLLKTPTKILEPGNSGKLIIAFFPTWNSFLNSMRTRKNAVKGLQVLEELVASEMIYHAEAALAPTNGIHAGIMQHIRAIEEGIEELEKEETAHASEATPKILAAENQIVEIETILENESQNYHLLEAWNPAFHSTITANDFTALRAELQTLIEWKERIEQESAQNLALGKRIMEWRAWEKNLVAWQQEIAAYQAAQAPIQSACDELAKSISSNESPSLRLAAKELVEAKTEKKWGYCAALLHQLEENKTTITAPALIIAQKHAFAACVERTRLYAESMRIGNALSEEEWLASNHGDPALAHSACKSALQNVETAYLQSTTVREWNTTQKEAHETLMLIDQLQLRGANGTRFEESGKKLRQRIDTLTHPQPFSALQENQREMEEALREARERIHEALQELVARQRWEIIAPASVEGNAPAEMVLEWKMRNPAGKPIRFPLELEVNIPYTAEIIESNVAWTEKQEVVALSLSEWNEPITIQARGSGIPVRLTEDITIGELIGNQARVRMTLNASAQADTTLPLEREKYGIGATAPMSIWVEDSTALLEQGRSILIPLRTPTTKILVDTLFQDVIRTTTALAGAREEEGIQTTTYTVTWKNSVAKPFRLSASTGIRIDPLETLSVQVLGELGETIPWNTTGEGSLGIQSQEIGANGMRTFTILIAQPQGIESWNVLKENLLQGIQQYTSSPFADIAAKAIALRHRVEQWGGDNNPQKWAEGLQKWQAELDALAVEENLHWQKKANLTARKSTIATGNTAEWERQRSAFDTFMEENNLLGAENAMTWLEQNDTNAAAIPVNATPTDGEIKNTTLGKAAEVNQTILSARDGAAAYGKELGITCNKLLETNFICPLSENQLKDLKEELEDLQKELRDAEKQLAKKDIKREAILPIAANLPLIEERTKAIATRIDDARSALQEQAEQMQKALEQYDIAEAEWKDNLQKVSDAMQANEYGKAIYVGRNLLAYAESKKQNITGLATLPEKTLPLLGVIFAVGGAGIFHWWKKKNPKPITMKSIPRTSERITSRPSPETGSDGSTSPDRRMESPPVQQARTRPELQSLQTPKRN